MQRPSGYRSVDGFEQSPAGESRPNLTARTGSFATRREFQPPRKTRWTILGGIMGRVARIVSAVCISHLPMVGLALAQPSAPPPPAEPPDAKERPEPASPAPAAKAEPAPGPVRTAPETIIVTGSRSEIPERELPMAVSVARLDPLGAAREGASLGEVLDGVPGLLARNRSNFAQDLRLSVRGFGARGAFGIRGLTIVLDGIPLTMPDGQAQIDIVDPDLLSRVEVLRGPAGALYGNGAGGVIVLESAGGATRPGVDASVQVGAYATRKLIARAGERTGPVTWAAAVSRLDSDGYRDRSRVEQTLVNANASWRIASSADLRLSATYLDSPVAQDSGGLTRDEMRSDPSLAAPNNVMFRTGESVREPTVGATLKVRLSPDDVVEGNAHLDARDFTGSVPFRIVELDHLAGGGGARYRSTHPVAGLPARLTAGVEAQRMRDERVNFDNADGAAMGDAILRQDERVQTVAAFAQAYVAPRRWLGLLAGARYDHLRFEVTDRLGDQSGSRGFDTVSTMAGAIASPDPDLDLDIYTNFGQSVESPTTTELAVRPGGAAGLNPDLDLQHATSLEVGMRGGHGPVTGELAAFHMWLRDELVPFEDPVTQQTYYRNAGRSHRTGAEAAANVALRQGLALRVAYTWLRARFDDYAPMEMDFAGNAVPGIAPHQLDATLSWRHERGPFASVEASYLRRMFVDDANTALALAPGHVLVEVGAGYRGCTGPLRYQVNVGVANLLDQVYVDNLRLNGAGGRYFEPGMPRRFFAGLTLGWAPPAERGRDRCAGQP
jgi:iron complex outermembrane recepter protein